MNKLNEVEITLLLQRHRQADPEALHQLLPIVYGELKRLARYWLTAQHPSWQPTRLVNEMFLQLFGGVTPAWNDRQHFFNTASACMRGLLIDATRRKLADKRGGGVVLLPLDEALNSAPLLRPELLALNEALEELAEVYPRPAKVVELRFFAGLSNVETATTLNLTERTVQRDWAFAKGWLLDYLQTTRAGISPAQEVQ